MKSALRRLRNAAVPQPPVPIAPYRYRGGGSSMFQLGGTLQSKEMQLRAYSMSGTLRAIVELLSSSAAQPEWHLYKKQPVDARRRYSTSDVGDDNRVQVIQHAALTLWNAPNPSSTRFAFCEGANQHFELCGETFWVLDRANAKAMPTGIWYVRPDRMQEVPSLDGMSLAGWMYNTFDGQQIPLETWQVIQEKNPDPMNPFRGLSPIASIMSNIQQQHLATDYMRNVFYNGAQPDGIIQLPEGTRMTDRDFDEFTSRWRESHMGVSNAGRVGVLDNGATWVAGVQSNRDLEYGELRLANRDEIREAYRMHPQLLGTTQDVNRANAQTAEEVFSSQLEIPRLDRRKDTLNSKLLPMFGSTGANVEFDYDDPSPANQEAAVTELVGKTTAALNLITAGYEPHAVLKEVGLPDMDVVEKAVQEPVAPPGWVPAPPAAPELSTGAKKPAAKPGADDSDADTMANLMKQLVGMNGHNYAGSKW